VLEVIRNVFKYSDRETSFALSSGNTRGGKKARVVYSAVICQLDVSVIVPDADLASGIVQIALFRGILALVNTYQGLFPNYDALSDEGGYEQNTLKDFATRYCTDRRISIETSDGVRRVVPSFGLTMQQTVLVDSLLLLHGKVFVNKSQLNYRSVKPYAVNDKLGISHITTVDKIKRILTTPFIDLNGSTSFGCIRPGQDSRLKNSSLAGTFFMRDDDPDYKLQSHVYFSWRHEGEPGLAAVTIGGVAFPRIPTGVSPKSLDRYIIKYPCDNEDVEAGYNNCALKVFNLLMSLLHITCIFTDSYLTYPPLYTPLLPSTPLYTPLHSTTPLCTPLHSYTPLYTPLHSYTLLYTLLYTPLHPSTPRYTPYTEPWLTNTTRNEKIAPNISPAVSANTIMVPPSAASRPSDSPAPSIMQSEAT
jgi:hypothetical protein